MEQVVLQDLPKTASSFFSIIADENFRTTSLGRDTWKTVIASQASLQSVCNREGFNVKADLADSNKARVTIGILGNEGSDPNDYGTVSS